MQKQIYFDNSATTPVHAKVVEKMLPFLKEDFGNPSSIHSFGRKIRVAIEEAREQIAELINAKSSEVFFVSGGTEANNFALTGISKTVKKENKKNKIITSIVEHHSILKTCYELSENDFEIKFIDIDNNCKIDFQNFIEECNSNVSLVSIIHINNETGSINDIKKISEIVKAKNIFIHTDAVQSFGKIKLDVKELNVDALSFSSHKIYGPKGIGAIYLKSETPVSPIIFGGSQERNRRGGTENVPAIIGFAEASKIAHNSMEASWQKITLLKNEFIKGIESIDKTGIEINCKNSEFPYIASLTFKNDFYKNDAEAYLMFFDLNGIAISNGSACSSGTLKPSHVILAMNKSIEDANGTLRFSFGINNTIEEVNYCLDIIQKCAKKFRRN